MKRILVVVLSVLVLTSSFCLAGAPHLLLDLAPIIAATAPPPPGPLREIWKLNGDWYFTVHYRDYPSDQNEFRFYRNTIDQLDSTIYIIEGDQFFSDFRWVSVDDVLGAYESKEKFYTIVSLWGPPSYDLGTAYVFKSIDKDTPGFDCRYFTDGDGHIQKYYKGFGGTVDCDPLTKRRRATAKMKQARKYVTPERQKEAMMARHLENIRRNMLYKSKGLPEATQNIPIQSFLNTIVEQSR